MTDYVFYPVTGNGETAATAYTWNTGIINFDTGNYWAQVVSFETLTIGSSPATGTVPANGANAGLVAGAIDPTALSFYSPDPAEGDPYINFNAAGSFPVDVLLNSGSVALDNLLLAGFNEFASILFLGSTPEQFPTLDVEGATLTVAGDILDTGTATFPTINTPLGPISSGTASGGGTIDLGGGASIDLSQTTGTVVPSDITFHFNDAKGNILEIDGDSVSNPTAFQGTITGFVPGDKILLPNIASMVGTVATTGTYDVATGVLSIVVGDPTTIDINLPGLTNASVSASGTGIEIQTTCYLHGTNILTESGEVAVEKLAMGDRVITRSGHAKPIRWIGRRSYQDAFAASNPELAPILIRAGALDEGIPHRDLYLSPEHAMYIDGVLVPARHLVNGTSIVTTHDIDPIRYYHIELEEHDVIYAEGAPAETFIDCNSRHIFHNAAEFATLYQNDPVKRSCARVIERGRKLVAINRRLAARAADLGLTEAASGPVAGYIDDANNSSISGWAWCQTAPTTPLRLEVLENDKVIGSVLADRFREDLQASGIGDGRHAFALTFTRPLDPFVCHMLTVRRASDHTPIAEPIAVEQATHLDGRTRDAFAALLRHATAHVQTAAEAETLLGLLHAEAEQARRARLRLLGREGPVELRRGAERAPARRALVIDAGWPQPDHDAGSQAIISHMRALQRLRWHVSFAAMAPPPENNQAKARLEAFGITCHATDSLEKLLRETADQYQLVYLHRLAAAGAYAGLVRRHQRRARLIYSVADLHHLRLARQAALEARPELARHAAFVRRQELLAAHQADMVITHSSVEAALLARDAPGAAVAVVPWAVQPRTALRPWTQREGVILIANFRHEPNADGLLWLFREVMPLVWEEAPVVLSVAGADLPAGIARTLTHRYLRVFGPVGEVWPLLAASRLAVAPLRYGAGIKGKVLEAWAAGLPCAMTPIAAEGLPPAETVATDAAGLARLIFGLHEDPVRNRAAARAGRAALRRHFSQKRTDSVLAAAINAYTEKPLTAAHRIDTERNYYSPSKTGELLSAAGRIRYSNQSAPDPRGAITA